MQHAPMPPAAGGRVYQLTDTTVSPVRFSGRDEEGNPREETVCALKHEKFVDTGGNICDVPIRTGRVAENDPASERYELLQRRDQIEKGCLPLAECPYTSEYRRWTNSETLLGDLPEGMKACNGAPDGCDHLKPIMEKRRAKSREKWESEQRKTANFSREQVESMVAAFGAGLAKSKSGVASAERKNLQTGKGESE